MYILKDLKIYKVIILIVIKYKKNIYFIILEFTHTYSQIDKEGNF